MSVYTDLVMRQTCLSIVDSTERNATHMSTQTALFAPLGVETAPEKSRPLLEKIQKSFKFIPNLFGVFANSPVLLEGYLGLGRTYSTRGA